ncbi:threonine-phosphate decarboxylase [Kushneria aurantia]|uniref:Aminotransferase n=1 Tax=Kushneria aurantia TaxID=504092 RepID=A0ABV6G4N4_9GAMM|nr:threonine-phosphate decarboxylase [Kushneria aurantia]
MHGGDLATASARFGIARQRWLDLSTGINPWPYPITPITAADCRALPDDGTALVEAARDYYLPAAHERLGILPVPGSQWAIERLPGLFERGGVALPHIGYREHAWRWQQAGHRPWFYNPDDLLDGGFNIAQADDLRAMVVVNPNNPGGQHHTPRALTALAQALRPRGALLIVDEAFADSAPAISLLPTLPDNVLVLRSLGKFFGLAGLRLGFAIGQGGADTPLERLTGQSGPWMISAPAQRGGGEALRDRDWQATMRQRLDAASQHQGDWLTERLGQEVQYRRRSALFNAFDMLPQRALDWHRRLAEQGVLTRLWPVDTSLSLLRIGLHDGADASWRRLDEAFRYAADAAIEDIP